jgi:hypothetical protein
MIVLLRDQEYCDMRDRVPSCVLAVCGKRHVIRLNHVSPVSCAGFSLTSGDGVD